MVSHSHTIERHHLGIQLPISTYNHNSTEAGTSVCSRSPPVPGELLIPDGNGKSHTRQKYSKATTMSSVALVTIVPLSINPQLTGQGQGMESPWYDHLGMLKKGLSLQPISSSLLISLSGAL